MSHKASGYVRDNAVHKLVITSSLVDCVSVIIITSLYFHNTLWLTKDNAICDLI